MVQINFARKEINCKLVYYGPGLSGKTTNLEMVHQRTPEQNKGELTSISTDGDRTLFFDFMPLDLGEIAGMKTKFHLYTVPGQVYYNSTRKLVLLGADGVIFIADSSRAKLQENRESLENLRENLAEMGKEYAKFPIVLQWNKRDVADAMTVEELNKELNPVGFPSFEAIAYKGEGVFQTLKALSAKVLASINRSEPARAAESADQAAEALKPTDGKPAISVVPLASAPVEPRRSGGAAPSPASAAPKAAVPAAPAGPLKIERNEIGSVPTAVPAVAADKAPPRVAAAASKRPGAEAGDRPKVASNPLEEIGQLQAKAPPRREPANERPAKPPAEKPAREADRGGVAVAAPPAERRVEPAAEAPAPKPSARIQGTRTDDALRREVRIVSTTTSSSSAADRQRATAAIVVGVLLVAAAVAAYFFFLS